MSLRETLYIIIFEHLTTSGWAFDVGLLAAIVVSVAFTMLETVHSLNSQHHTFFLTAERIFTGLFTVEYMLRVYCHRPARAYIFSFFGAVDICAILPSLLEAIFHLSSHREIRIVRVLRLLRVFRVCSALGLSGEADALRAAFWASRRKVIVFLLAILMIVTVMGTAVYIVEDPKSGFTSIPRSIYWAIVTVTTVGYGDISPQSVPGQALASLMMTIGYSLLAVPTGIAAVEYSRSELLSLDVTERRRPRRARQGSGCHPGSAILPTRACASCEAIGHDDDAAFCKYCGSGLGDDDMTGQDGGV
jgi:voltage-gated potassium channel